MLTRWSRTKVRRRQVKEQKKTNNLSCEHSVKPPDGKKIKLQPLWGSANHREPYTRNVEEVGVCVCVCEIRLWWTLVSFSGWWSILIKSCPQQHRRVQHIARARQSTLFEWWFPPCGMCGSATRTTSAWRSCESKRSESRITGDV